MSQTKRQVEISKFMSYALRHKPGAVGLTLLEGGWAKVYDLVDAHNRQLTKHAITTIEVLEVVRTCEKQRYSLSTDLTLIRANQGHSIEVDLNLRDVQPIDFLYHGTATRFYQQILAEGIKKMSRQHVHLSADFETAKTVGGRHGMPHILKIDAPRMHDEGIKFWISTNGVWLTDYVDPKYIFKPIKENA